MEEKKYLIQVLPPMDSAVQVIRKTVMDQNITSAGIIFDDSFGKSLRAIIRVIIHSVSHSGRSVSHFGQLERHSNYVTVCYVTVCSGALRRMCFNQSNRNGKSCIVEHDGSRQDPWSVQWGQNQASQGQNEV